MKTIIPLDNLFDDPEDQFSKSLDSELSKAVEELLEGSKEEKEKDDDTGK